MNQFKPLPDVTSETLQQRELPLQWVGMEQIDVPVCISIDEDNVQRLPAKASVFVSLADPLRKGIHMSRLYTVLGELGREPCTMDLMDRLLGDCVDSQGGISENARIALAFDLLLEKPALLSGEVGYQAYPIVISASAQGGQRVDTLELTIPYSSTCPCSASLARQLLANAIDEQFQGQEVDKASLLSWIQSEEGSVATPHAQRSFALIRLVTKGAPWPLFPALIREFEGVLGTPVQTAVKRIDEQAFSTLNAKNLMFCEDTARRLKEKLEAMPDVLDYWLKVEHQESLHAHNAVVIDQKHPGASEPA